MINHLNHSLFSSVEIIVWVVTLLNLLKLLGLGHSLEVPVIRRLLLLAKVLRQCLVKLVHGKLRVEIIVLLCGNLCKSGSYLKVLNAPCLMDRCQNSGVILRFNVKLTWGLLVHHHWLCQDFVELQLLKLFLLGFSHKWRLTITLLQFQFLWFRWVLDRVERVFTQVKSSIALLQAKEGILSFILVSLVSEDSLLSWLKVKLRIVNSMSEMLVIDFLNARREIRILRNLMRRVRSVKNVNVRIILPLHEYLLYLHCLLRIELCRLVHAHAYVY